MITFTRLQASELLHKITVAQETPELLEGLTPAEVAEVNVIYFRLFDRRRGIDPSPNVKGWLRAEAENALELTNGSDCSPSHVRSLQALVDKLS